MAAPVRPRRWSALVAAALLLPLTLSLPTPAAAVPLVQESVDDVHDRTLHFVLDGSADNRSGLLQLTNVDLAPGGLSLNNTTLPGTVTGPGVRMSEPFFGGLDGSIGADVPDNASVEGSFRVSLDNLSWGPWLPLLPANLTQWGPPEVFVQWRVLLAATNGSAGPLLRGLDLRYQVNTRPGADAGPDQLAFRSQTVVLQGNHSTDADGDGLSYIWQQLDGPTAALSDLSAAMPTFEPNQLGAYRFRMVISDSLGSSDLDETQVFVDNHPPVADAGADQTVWKGAQVQLNGSATDADDPQSLLSYQWNQLAGPTSPLSGSTTATAGFSADAAGTYLFGLRVGDGHDLSAEATTNVTVLTRSPVAVLHVESQTVEVNTSVLIDASGSNDPDGRVDRYWFDLGDGTTLDDSPSPTLAHRYNRTGTYTLTLTVVDDDGNASAPVALELQVVQPPPPPPPNEPPTGTIVATRRPLAGQVVYDLLADVTDPDGFVVTLAWDFGDGSPLQVGPATAVSHTYGVKGQMTVKAVVTDDDGASVTLTVVLQIVNAPPLLTSWTPAPLSLSLEVGQTLNLSVAADDPDDAISALRYVWSIDGVAQGSAAADYSLTPVAAGIVQVEVRVVDPSGASANHTWTIGVTEAPAGPSPPPQSLPWQWVLVVALAAGILVAGWALAWSHGRRRRKRRRGRQPAAVLDAEE